MVYVNSVDVRPGSVKVQTGQWYYGAVAEVCPINADCTEVVWHSDNSSVASVNAISGYIYGISPGTARIYATATDGSGASDCITVTVSNTILMETVSLNRASVSIEKGNVYTLAAGVYPENTTDKTIHWRSTNTSVAEVTNGAVTAKNCGNTYIYAEAADGSPFWQRYCQV